ncbi:MAG: chemotaxis protein CheW [Syntrophorhabdaceae bacterium]|nr:chemotaxis protein CheW [Syntrophorhabdaceae bacterium]
MPEIAETDKAARSIDWRQVHSRVETARLAMEQGCAKTQEEKIKILKERARTLSQEREEKETDTGYIDVVAFSLAYEEYAIESFYVREVYPMKELTPVPGTPPFVLGIINVRGQILSVIDIKKFFDLPEKGLTDLNKVIIIRDDSMEFGILADVVLGTRHIMLSEIQQSLPGFTGIRAQYLKGVTRGRAAVLDAGKLLSDKNIIVHEDAG